MNKLGNILITILGGLLLVYSGFRSVDFIAMTLPADRQILAFFGLAALDIGLVFWLINYMRGSRGQQRPISLIMVIVDFLGAVAMFTLDTLYSTGKSGMTTQLDANTIQASIFGLSLVIATNIGATVLHHLLDPELQRRMIEEEAKDKIEDQALKEITQNGDALAVELAPQIASAWKKQILANYQTLMSKRKSVLPELPAPVLAQAAPAMNVLAQDVSLAVPIPEGSAALPENPTKPARKVTRSRKVS